MKSQPAASFNWAGISNKTSRAAGSLWPLQFATGSCYLFKVLMFRENLRPYNRDLGKGGEAEEGGGQTDVRMGELLWSAVCNGSLEGVLRLCTSFVK